MKRILGSLLVAALILGFAAFILPTTASAATGNHMTSFSITPEGASEPLVGEIRNIFDWQGNIYENQFDIIINVPFNPSVKGLLGISEESKDTIVNFTIDDGSVYQLRNNSWIVLADGDTNNFNSDYEEYSYNTQFTLTDDVDPGQSQGIHQYYSIRICN